MTTPPRPCPLCGSLRNIPIAKHAANHLVRCGDCSLVFTQLDPSVEELVAYYTHYPVRDQLSPVTAKRYDELLDRFEPYRRTGKLIDVGCGAGMFLERAALRGWEVHGTEYGDRAVAACKARGVGIIEGPLDPANYAPGSFDVVCSFEVMEHLAHPKEEMERMLKILRPGGLLYITTPNYACIGHRLSGAEWNVVNYPEHLTYFTPSTLRRMAKSAGLRERWLLTTGMSMVRFRTKRSKDPGVRSNAMADQEALRVRLETAWHLKLAKRTIDGLLDLFGIGDSMKAAFEKPAQ
ncbi:MAG: class I SAM-dependent methyltransferase [Flavobacteriales bacterium]